MKRPIRLCLFVAALSILLNGVLAVRLSMRTTPPRPDRAEAKRRHSSLLDRKTLPPREQVTRTSLLNSLVERHGYRSYLEIGQGNRRMNYDWVNCRIKIGVDPDRSLNAAYQLTSDDFFAINNDAYDLIFIDGLHTAEQVGRDILSSLRVLRPNGTILVHDCNPTTREMQLVPQRQLTWTGDVWKAWVTLRAERSDLTMYVIDVESGCGLIRRGRQATVRLPAELTYEALARDRTALLNLVDVTYFLEDLRRGGTPSAAGEPGGMPVAAAQAPAK